jgi:hypothetical protein
VAKFITKLHTFPRQVFFTRHLKGLRNTHRAWRGDSGFVQHVLVTGYIYEQRHTMELVYALWEVLEC